MKFQKGHPGYKKKGTKHKTTLLKEERIAKFDEEMTDLFVAKIKEARPEYLLDQYMGKALTRIEVTGKDGKDLIPETSEKAQELLHAILNKSGRTSTD